MHPDILGTHITNVLNVVDSPALVFYKGIDAADYLVLGKGRSALPHGGSITEAGIDLKGLNDQAAEMMSAIISYRDGIYLGMYEQLQVLPVEFLERVYKGKIVVVENNIYNMTYPAPLIDEYNEALEEYLSFLSETEEPIDESETIQLLSSFYTNVVKVKGRFFVSHRDVSSDAPSISMLYFVAPTGDKVELEDDSCCGDLVTLSPTAPEEIMFHKSRILEASERIQIHILIDKPIWQDAHFETEFSAFFEATRCLHDVRFFRKSNEIRPEIDDKYLDILKKYWGASSFRKFAVYKDPDRTKDKLEISQGEIIQNVIAEIESAVNGRGYQDIFVTAPTGAGKSLLFQIPAIHVAEAQGLVTIVISPLKALMKDQVDAMHQRGIEYCAYVNSDLSPRQKEEILDDVRSGKVSILYISPEMFLAYDVRYLIGERRLGLVVIDEAHLVTTWGRDFRVDYWYLGTYIDRMRKYSVDGQFVVAAFTATVVYGGDDDMFFETINSLDMRSPKKYLGNTRRENIGFRINRWRPANYSEERSTRTGQKIAEYVSEESRAIVYFPYTAQVSEQLDSMSEGIKGRVAHYHGRLDAAIKDDSERAFREGRATVMLATKAFGMGVDISDVTHVYHHAPTGNLCDYVQEVGRAARDKSIIGLAEQDFCERDLSFTKILYGISSMRQYQLREMIKKLYSVHKTAAHRNFLMSVDTFAYLFPNDTNVENRVKNGLMLIEKDLEKKYGYPVVLVRPKSLFSKAFVVVPSSVESQVLSSRYGEHFSLRHGMTRQRVVSRNSYASDVEVSDVGPIYEVNLKAIWEQEFRDISFPMLKKRFYDLELFEFAEPLAPRFKLTIDLNCGSLERGREELASSLQNVVNSFDSLYGRFFEADEFRRDLQGRTGNELIARKTSNLLLHMFSVEQRKTWERKRDLFIQRRRTGERDEYRLQDRSYGQLPGRMLRTYNQLISHLYSESCSVTRYIPVGSKSLFIDLAFVLEALGLSSYEIRGGECPEMFVRVNDPHKLRMLASDNSPYSNAILTDVMSKRNRSIERMKDFFLADMNDSSRWDYIEDYFLGR